MYSLLLSYAKYVLKRSLLGDTCVPEDGVGVTYNCFVHCGMQYFHLLLSLTCIVLLSVSIDACTTSTRAPTTKSQATKEQHTASRVSDCAGVVSQYTERLLQRLFACARV